MNNCLFCQIVDKKIPTAFEYENESVIAIRDINPQAPHHLLVISKKHIARISGVGKEDAAVLAEMILCATTLSKQFRLEEVFRLIFNNGPKAGQSVFHIHLHLL